MITNWTILDPLGENTTTFRFMCNDEENDLKLAEYLIKKYIGLWGFTTEGLIKIVYDEGNIFYEIITTLPFSTYLKNNDFFEFEAENPRKLKGVKKKMTLSSILMRKR